MIPELQIFITVLSGVTIFVLGQMIVRFILDPLQQFKFLIGEIADDLIYLAYLYSNPGVAEKEELKKGAAKIRKDASKLKAIRQIIPYYLTWQKYSQLPSDSEINIAHSRLIQLSNSFFQGNFQHTEKAVDTIRDSLHIKL